MEAGTKWAARPAPSGQTRPRDATDFIQGERRIAIGSDAVFLDNHKGAITLNKLVVTAVADDELPKDAIDHLVSIG